MRPIAGRSRQSKVQPTRRKVNVSLPPKIFKRLVDLSAQLDITVSYTGSEIICAFLGCDSNGRKHATR